MKRDMRFLLRTHYSNSRALLIGINRYTKVQPLYYAVSDAEEMQKVLVEDLKFPPENVTLLRDGEATRANILRTYLAFTRGEVDLDERILVFFAGHGDTRTGIRGEIGYLIPVDGDPDDLSTFIRWKELTENAELVRAKHMLFIMDACYGGLALTRNLAPGSARFLKDMMLRYSRQVLTAGKADEVVADSGGPIPDHSVFTGHLIEGLRGKAHSEDGILTANGLMSYVFGKVSKDKNSNQTPHYGYFDGDGDFILNAPQLEALEASDQQDLDTIVVMPVSDDEPSEETTQQKIKTVKLLLSSESSVIQLHDFLVEEVRRFLSATSEDHFKVQGTFSQEELLERIAKYEGAITDLSLLSACVAHWAKPEQKTILQKVLSRSTDLLEPQHGISTWLNLRWYPMIIEIYCSGIAAVAAGRFDSLAAVFLARVGVSTHERKDALFAESVAEAILDLTRQDIFKRLPGHERHYAAMSEYLFKILQPPLDDLLFLGKGYETAFDDFEVLFALTVADLRKEHGNSIWGPIGRFGWKQRDGGRGAPLARVLAQGREAGSTWEPLKHGLFGGNAERFDAIGKEFQQRVAGVSWW